jgi:hypothetical protein
VPNMSMMQAIFYSKVLAMSCSKFFVVGVDGNVCIGVTQGWDFMLNVQRMIMMMMMMMLLLLYFAR